MALKIAGNTHCLNCEAVLEGPFCAKCGQRDSKLDISFWEMVRDYLGDAFTFDSRFWKSLRKLMVKPGFLTLIYNSGKRVRYTPPLRLYLFISVFFFASVTLLNPQFLKINEIQVSQPQETTGTETTPPAPALREPPKQETSPEHGGGGSIGQLMIALKDDTEVINKTISKRLPQIVFLLVPIFALLVALFFRGSGLHYLQHLVFALHIHAFNFVVLGFLTLLAWIFPPLEPFRVAGIPVAAIYLFMAASRNYGKGFWGTLLRTFLLGSTYVLVLLMMLTLTAALTLLFL